jgi:Leucine-rich repeat (LRR) protein
MFKKYLFLFLVPTLVFCLLACAEESIFPDNDLEEAIREAIEKPEGDILPIELEGLTSLQASEKGITDLTGLEYCTNLADLNLWDNHIRDISAMDSLKNLTHLNVGHNQIKDVSPLNSMHNLIHLSLHENQISDQHRAYLAVPYRSL